MKKVKYKTIKLLLSEGKLNKSDIKCDSCYKTTYKNTDYLFLSLEDNKGYCEECFKKTYLGM